MNIFNKYIIEDKAKKRDKQYSAGKDFRCNIFVEHSDGSKFYFRYAKLVNDYFWIPPPLSRWSVLHYVIHTEHNGIHIFNSLDVEKIEVEIRDDHKRTYFQMV